MTASLSMPGGWEWLAILAVGGLIFLFVKSGRKGRWILGSILLAPVLMAALLFAVRFGMHTYAIPVVGQQMSISQTSIEDDGLLTSQTIQYHNGSGTDVAQFAVRTGSARVYSDLLLITLLLLGLFAVLLVFLFVKSGRKGRIIIGSLAGGAVALFALTVVAHFFVRQPYEVARVFPNQLNAPRTPEQQRQAAESQAEYLKHSSEVLKSYNRSQAAGPEPTTQPSGGSGVERHDLAAAGFEPDIYASKNSAVRALACLLTQSYIDVGIPRDGPPRKMMLAFQDVPLGPGTIPEMIWPNGPGAIAVSAVRDVLGSINCVEIVHAPGATGPRSKCREPFAFIMLNLRVAHDAVGETPGRVEGDIDGDLGQFKRHVDFVNKPWADDFEAWSRANDGPSWVLGRSSDFSPTRREAESIASANAIADIRKRVLASRPLLGQSDQTAESERNRWLDDFISSQFAAGQFHADWFTQEFKRPYGSVWRSAVLIHLPPEKARSFLNAYSTYVEARRTTWLHTLLSAAGLFGVILAVYLFLSMATRGYYVWSVRLATVALAGVGVWCIMAFVR